MNQTLVRVSAFELIKRHLGRRRLAFLFHYLLARAGAKSISRLLPIVEKSFDHPWVTRVKLSVRFSPGKETRLSRLWRLLNSLPKSDLIYWDAPVTISVFRKRGRSERQALCMSLYIRSGVLYVVQLQGVAGTDIPAELRFWPKMFIESCKRFACQQGLREVRVAKASTLPSFRHPYGRPETLTDDLKRALPRIRRDMELLYDRNALDLGLISDGDWFRWQNARVSRGHQLSVLQHATPVAASLGLMAAVTIILFQVHTSESVPQRLVYFYLFPLILIVISYAQRVALMSAGAALLCADYFLQEPVYSFYTSDYDDLVGFGILAVLAIKFTRKLLPRSGGG